MDRVSQIRNKLSPAEALELTAALEKYKHAGRLAAEMVARGRSADVEKRHNKLLTEANWILVELGREHGIKFRDDAQKALDEEMTKAFTQNVRARQWVKNPAENLGSLMTEVRNAAKRVGAASGKAKWTEHKAAMKEMNAALKKIETHYPQSHAKAKEMAQNLARRSIGKNPRRWDKKPPAGSPITYRVKRDSEWQEWQVIALINGKRYDPYTYFAGDGKDGKKDAEDTRAAMQKDYPVVLNPYMGFKKLTAKLQRRGARSPKALAAWIGRRKYGKKKFQAMARAGRKAAKARGVKVLRFPYRAAKKAVAANSPKGKKLSLALIALYGVGAYLLYGAMKKS